MATGLFATLIIGTIIQQIGNLVGGSIADTIFLIGKMAAAVTGAGIGCGVAHRFKRAATGFIIGSHSWHGGEPLLPKFWLAPF